MSAIEDLLALDEAIKEHWETLKKLDAETVEGLQLMLTQVAEIGSAAKSELRKMGAGNHEFGPYAFRVAPGSSKTVFNTDDVLMEAEDRGHLQDLLDSGFVTYSVDAKQLDRLPSDLKAVYAGLGTEKKGSARVFLPKDLC